MSGDYLMGLGTVHAEQLKAANAPGLAALRRYLNESSAIAFLGAGVSVPLYPLWSDLIAKLTEIAVSRGLERGRADTLQQLAQERPDTVVESLRRQLGAAQFAAAVREALQVQRDPETGRTWTPTQELVCRCAFKAILTTNYDPGIVDARMRVRSAAVGTGFTSYTDELALDRWRAGEIFGDTELPILFVHGHHNQPDAIVLAATEYRRAYAGKLARVLGNFIEADHLVWIGFSFRDQRINDVLREVAEHSGTRIDPGLPVRHVAIMPWEPDSKQDPWTLRELAEIEYGTDLVLYPVHTRDHSALQRLLATFVDKRFGAVAEISTPVTRINPAVPRRWVPAAEPVEHFTGRTEEMARLDRWASDPGVRLIGVTAWGGAGKTALITEWVEGRAGADRREEIRGLFGWSFYANPSVEIWATKLLAWARRQFGIRFVGRGRLGQAILALLQAVPVMLVLDGLEVLQEGLGGGTFGRLLDGTLREVLTGACRLSHRGLILLTSRFPFADLEIFDGGAVRMLQVPPFTTAEGSAVLSAYGAAWLSERARRDLVANVDGHALAVAALGGILTDQPTSSDLALLQTSLADAVSTDARVSKVLSFYAERLPEAYRYLVAAIALFSRSERVETILKVAQHRDFRGRLDGWDASAVRTAVRGRLSGLVSWQPDGTVSAHPLVRTTFRPLALGAAEVASEITLADLPERIITDKEQGLRLMEAVELLLDAEQWDVANNLYRSRTNDGHAWLHLPAARLGQRTATAFVATPARRRAISDNLGQSTLDWYLTEVGGHSMNAGDMQTAQEYLYARVEQARATGGTSLIRPLRNLAWCLGRTGDLAAARTAATEALRHATNSGQPGWLTDCHFLEGWLAYLLGETAIAENHYRLADQIHYTNSHPTRHLYSLRGAWWAQFLAATGRTKPARTLTKTNQRIGTEHGLNDTVARCAQLLARLELAGRLRGDLDDAWEKAQTAVSIFRDGDNLTELADALPIAAEVAFARGDPGIADNYLAESLEIAAPRGLAPAQAAALCTRARLHLQDSDLHRARDDADAALRIATNHDLAWQELSIVDTQAKLDELEETDHGWAAKARTLRTHLIPGGLDPDPLSTIEHDVSAATRNRRI